MRSLALWIPFMGPSTNEIYAGVHYRKRTAQKNKAVAHVHAACRGAEGFDKPVTIDLVPVCGSGFTRRDLSNYSYTLKLIEDGLVKAGMLVDDTWRHVMKISIHSAIERRDLPNSGVVVRITETDQQHQPEWAKEAIPA